MKKKKFFCTVLLLGVLLLWNGCGEKTIADETQDVIEQTQNNKNNITPTPGWQLHAEDEVTLEWYVNYSWFTTPWGENLVSKTITEETGINVEFVTPIGNESEKLNAMISSNSLPDIITMGWWENQLDEMINKDMVYALNELADEYDMYFWEVANEQIMELNRSDDGNVYVYPNSYYLPEDYEEIDSIGSNQTFLVRKDIYEAIGSPDMSTRQGFKNAVRKAVEMFPEVDGQPLIPIGAHTFDETGCVSFDQYLQNFLAVPHEKNGAYYDRYTDLEYIRWLKTFRQLGSEGYLARDIFIDQRTQMEEKLAQGRYFCMIYQRTDIEAQQKELYVNHPERVYIAVDGPKNTRREDHVLPGTGSRGWTVTLISKDCERPDRAIELISYLLSEHGQKRIYLGVEGVTYDMVDGQPVLKPEVKQLLDTDRAAYDRLYGADDAYWMLQDNAMQLAWKPEPGEPLGQLEVWTYQYTHYMGQYEISFEADSEAGNVDTNIKKLWSQTLPQLLLAESDEKFDEILQEFVEKRDELGYDILVEESEKQYQEMRKRLGME